jgi:hypothetical protein
MHTSTAQLYLYVQAGLHIIPSCGELSLLVGKLQRAADPTDAG